MSYTTENCIPLSPAYMQTTDRWANTTQTSSFPWSLSVLLHFLKWPSTESRNIRSRIFVLSSGSFSVTYSNITNVLPVKDNVRLGKILQPIFYKLPFYKHYTFCFKWAHTRLHINSLLAESLKLVITTQIYRLPKQYENLISKHNHY